MTALAPDEFLTVPEVASRLRVDPATVRRWIADDRLPAVKIGRQYRVEAAQVAAMIVHHRTSQPLTTTRAAVLR